MHTATAAATTVVNRVVTALSGAAVCVAGFVLSAAPAPEAEAITIREDVAIKTINNRSNRPRYYSIGRIDTSAPFLSGSLTGTGTLVAPDWVLTAAHVVDGTSATRFTLGGQEYGIEGWTAPAGYDSNSSSFNQDIALVKLDRPVTDIAPAQLYRTNNSELTRTAMILGYGYSGTGDVGENTRTAQTLRISTNRIDGIQGGAILLTDFNAPDGSGNQLFTDEVTRFEGGLTAGDSGGPAFIYDGSGFTLGALAVFTADPNDGTLDGNYGEVNGFLRVRPHLSFIDSVLGGSYSLRSTFTGNSLASSLRFAQGDLDQPLTNWGGGSSGSSLVVDGSASVSQGSLDLVLQNWGGRGAVVAGAVPEPGAAVLLGGTALLGVRRRR